LGGTYDYHEEPEIIQVNYDQLIENELTAYKAAQRLARGSNPLEWWRLNVKFYPYLSMVAKRFLAIPATNASVERLFSVAGETISKKRTSLNQDTADSLIFLHETGEFIKALETNMTLPALSSTSSIISTSSTTSTVANTPPAETEI